MTVSVLLVDDHQIFRKGLRFLVEEEEDLSVVGEAGDGQSALELTQELSPDVVVMDISMPGMDGIEATRHIVSEFPNSRVMVLSIHGEKRFVEDMLQAGAAGYVLKEDAPEELVDGIRTVARGDVYLSAAITGIVVAQYRSLLDGEPSAGADAELSEVTAIPLRQTKLHQTQISARVVPRARLLDLLEEGSRRPLSLVCAPAGYGKSTLVSQWLEEIDWPSAWLSLDTHDNDLRLFLGYFVAAVQTIYDEDMQATLALLRAPDLPPLPTLVRTLVNELDRLPQRFILVLDDYHCIDDPAIHEALAELLLYPPGPLHLVLVSRSDPSLDLFRFRAQNQMSEVRAQALSFTVDETTAFLEQVVGMGIEEGIARALTEKTEGWVTGLHLITLSAQSNADLADVSRVLPGEQQTLDYLIAEALSHQPRELQAWLLKTSILNRFCASLCEAVCASPPSGEASSIDGVEFLRWLTENNLLVVSLDHGGQWFRYHHLFQELLQSQLDNVLEVDETAGLHMRASAWFNAQGMIDDAIKHALAAGNVVAAAELVEEHRHAQHDADRWYVVEQWLAMLPQEIKQQRAGLLLAQAWTYFVHFRQDLIPQVLEQVASLLDDETADPLYLGELDFFRGNLHYWVGEAESSVRYLEEALAQLSGREPFAENNTEVMLGLARSMAGQKDQAIQGINDRIGGADTLPGTILTYRIGGLAFIHLLAGELLQARAQGERLQTVAGQAHIPNSEAWGSYLQGCSQLHTGNFDDAVFHFAAAAQHRYVLDTGALLDAHAGIALSYQLMQQDDAAVQAMKRLIELAREVGDPYCLSVAHSCQARLALLRGDLASATQWALSANESSAPSSLFLWLEVPAITQARVLIAVGSEGNLEKASELLQEIRHQSEACHFTNQLIEVAVLQSLSLGRQRRNKRALVVLEEAVILAAPGGWIRPFLEAGQPMADLLVQLQEQGVADDLAMYVDQVLSFFPTVADPGRQGGLIEPPTERELQVLRLLATELNANEIAEQLVVSVATVRAHTRSVYSKLDVHSRYEAVQQAQKLGLI